jgi:hypothetical protein
VVNDRSQNQCSGLGSSDFCLLAVWFPHKRGAPVINNPFSAPIERIVSVGCGPSQPGAPMSTRFPGAAGADALQGISRQWSNRWQQR